MSGHKNNYKGVSSGDLCYIIDYNGRRNGPYVFLHMLFPHTENNFSNLYVMVYYDNDGVVQMANTSDYSIMKFG